MIKSDLKSQIEHMETLNRIFAMPDTIGIMNSLKELQNIKAKQIDALKLKHEYDSTRGLYCIDRDPKEVSYEWILENAFQLT